MNPFRSVLAALSVAAAVAACGGGAGPAPDPGAGVSADPSKLALAGEGDTSNSLDSLMRSCIVQYMGQGLSPAMALRLCNARVSLQFPKGATQPIAESVAAFAKGFEPPSLQALCGAGNPKISAGFWSGYTMDQLSRELAYAKDQRGKAAAEGDKAAEAQWDADAREIFAAMEELEADGGGAIPPTTNRPGPASTCSEVTTLVVQTLMECSRVGWKNGGCDVLAARLSNCPDPRLAYIDPSQGGLACQQAADPEAVRKAWELECQSRTNGDVCGPKKAPDGTPVYPSDQPGEVCGNPKAYVDGDSCVVQLPTPKAPGTSLQDILLFAFKNFGGPVFSLGGPKGPPCTKC